MNPDLNSFRSYLLQKYPNKTKDINSFVDKKIKQNQAVESVRAGRLTLEQLPAEERASVASGLPADFETITKKQKESGEVKSELKSKADALLAVMEAGKTGKLTGDQLQTALTAAASNLAAAKGFAEGGKTLTVAELGILSGSQPAISQPVQSWFSKLIGRDIDPRGKVLDKPEDLRLKAELLSRGFGDRSGQTIDQILSELGVQKPGGAEEPMSLKGFVGNVAGNVQRTGEGIGNILTTLGVLGLGGPKDAARKQRFQEMGLPTSRTEAVQGLSQIPGGMLDAIDMLIQDPVRFAYENPVDVATAAIAPMSSAKTSAGKVGLDNQLRGGRLPVREIAKGGAARLATSVVTPDPEDVVKSENLAKTVLQATKANTSRGIAKELKQSVLPKAESFIDDRLAKITEKVGQMPLDEVVDEVMASVGNSSAAKVPGNAKLVARIKRDVASRIASGKNVRGAVLGTDHIALRKANKAYNKQLSGWFEAGKPTASATDIYNSLTYEANKSIRKIIGESAGGEDFFRALSVEEAALEAYPVLSRKALSTQQGLGMYGRVINALKGPVEPVGVAAARFAQGKPDQVIQQILSGQLSPEAPLAPAAGARTPLTGVSPIDELLNSSPVTTVGSRTPGSQLIRDKRYRSPVFRGR